MTTDIVSGGKLESTSRIDRGEPLVYSEAEWRARSRPYRRRIVLGSSAISSVFIGFPLFLLIAVLVFFPDHGGILMMVLLFGGLTICFGIISVFIHLADRKEIASTPPEGLYERGVQLFHFIFVPYEEISTVNERMVKGRPAIELRLHSHEDESIKERQSKVWRIPKEFLGEEGTTMLNAKVHAPGSP